MFVDIVLFSINEQELKKLLSEFIRYFCSFVILYVLADEGSSSGRNVLICKGLVNNIAKF